MRAVYLTYGREEPIPVQEHLPSRKLAKYLSRETAAGVAAAGALFQRGRPEPETPLYYATGIVEHEDFGLDEMLDASRAGNGPFSREMFLAAGIARVSPLMQFRVLYNMPLSFISIFFGLTGDNAVLYGSSRGLLLQALHANGEGPLLLGAGKVRTDGSVAAGLALGRKAEFAAYLVLALPDEPLDLFRLWVEQQ